MSSNLLRIESHSKPACVSRASANTQTVDQGLNDDPRNACIFGYQNRGCVSALSVQSLKTGRRGVQMIRLIIAVLALVATVGTVYADDFVVVSRGKVLLQVQGANQTHPEDFTAAIFPTGTRSGLQDNVRFKASVLESSHAARECLSILKAAIGGSNLQFIVEGQGTITKVDKTVKVIEVQSIRKCVVAQ
jgi:hypothetical protein